MLDDFLKRRPYNAAADFIDGNVARGLGDKLAFVDPERSLSYRSLQSRSFQFAAALKTWGLRPEDRIALDKDVLDSLNRADPDIDQLWAREASDRLAAYRRGELAAKDLGAIVGKYRR